MVSSCGFGAVVFVFFSSYFFWSFFGVWFDLTDEKMLIYTRRRL